MSWVLMSIVGGSQDASGRGNAVGSIMYHNKSNVWGGRWLEMSPEYRLGQTLKGFESSGKGLELYIRSKR